MSDDETPETFDASIDKDRLDDEWLHQPRLMHHWSTQLANARAEEVKAKDRLALRRAEIEFMIRQEPDEYLGNVKATEASVTAAVTTHPAVQKALKDYNEARRDADLHQAAVTALEHRKRALENLVKLWGGDYFSAPIADTAAAREGLGKARHRGGFARGKAGLNKKEDIPDEDFEEDE